jgi:hypothetical protein
MHTILGTKHHTPQEGAFMMVISANDGGLTSNFLGATIT